MSNIRTKKGILIAAFSWIVILGSAAVTYKYVVYPILRGKPISEKGIDISNATVDAKPLSDVDWKKLVIVNDIQIDSITFGRGKSEISIQSQRTLDETVSLLQKYPEYYLVVIGNARSDGDAEIANKLVKERVEETANYLAKAGLVRNRIIQVPSRPSGNSGEAQIVNFIVGKIPN